MTLSVTDVLRVMEACETVEDDQAGPLVSFIVPKNGGGWGQILLKWRRGKPLRDYIRDPALTGVLSVYQATRCRVVDQLAVKRGLSHTPNAGDEIRFIPVRS